MNRGREGERTGANPPDGPGEPPTPRGVRIKRRTAAVLDTRTERWQAAGLADQVDKAEARKAGREAILLGLVLIAVLGLFAFRVELFPEFRKEMRYVTAALLVLIGWGFARTAAKGLAPALMRRMDPATAGTVGFLIRLTTIIAVIFGSLAIAGVKLETLAVGGAFTAVIVGLAAQQSLGNVIAGAMLLSTRPFRVADRIKVQGSGINAEGVVASLGLFYTTLVSGGERIMIPNSTLMTIAVHPLSDPDAVELTARFTPGQVTPVELQGLLEEGIDVPLRRPPRVELEEMDVDDELTMRIVVVPERSHDGAELASQVISAITLEGGESAATAAKRRRTSPDSGAREDD